MKDGYIKVAAATPKVKVADTKENSEDSQESDSAKNSEELKVANSGEENQADTSSKNAKQQSNTELAFTLEKSRSKQPTHWRIHAAQKMSNTKKPFIFTQYDPEWCATPYGGGGCMGTAGCGILATVNAVYALNGQYMNVMELAPSHAKPYFCPYFFAAALKIPSSVPLPTIR